MFLSGSLELLNLNPLKGQGKRPVSRVKSGSTVSTETLTPPNLERRKMKYRWGKNDPHSARSETLKSLIQNAAIGELPISTAPILTVDLLRRRLTLKQTGFESLNKNKILTLPLLRLQEQEVSNP
jgi:hypothetical protein